MYLVHAVEAVVRLYCVAELAAAEQSGKELVQMGEEEATIHISFGSQIDRNNSQLIAILAVRGLVFHQRCRTPTVEEVDNDTAFTTCIRRGELTVEVLQEIDLLAIVIPWSQDAWDRVVVWLCVIADDSSVYEQVKQKLLILLAVRFEKRLRVVVTNGDTGWSAGCNGTCNAGQTRNETRNLHPVLTFFNGESMRSNCLQQVVMVGYGQ